jgi:hypothetical protein
MFMAFEFKKKYLYKYCNLDMTSDVQKSEKSLKNALSRRISN